MSKKDPENARQVDETSDVQDQTQEQESQVEATEEEATQEQEELLTPQEAEELREKAAQAEVHHDAWLRVMADLQNLQRRLHREKQQARKMALRDLTLGLLPCFDNLNRAIASADSGSMEAVVQGVQMVHQEIHRILEDHGVKALNPIGETLDPNLHEAMGSRPSADCEANTVLDVLEPGYALGEIIIRPARVVVSTTEASPADEDSEAKEN